MAGLGTFFVIVGAIAQLIQHDRLGGWVATALIGFFIIVIGGIGTLLELYRKSELATGKFMQIMIFYASLIMASFVLVSLLATR